ncbi:uncharacterized [Tachysurus ichikawai]
MYQVAALMSCLLLDSPPGQRRLEKKEQDEDEGAVGDALDESVLRETRLSSLISRLRLSAQSSEMGRVNDPPVAPPTESRTQCAASPSKH